MILWLEVDLICLLLVVLQNGGDDIGRMDICSMDVIVFMFMVPGSDLKLL